MANIHQKGDQKSFITIFFFKVGNCIILMVAEIEVSGHFCIVDAYQYYTFLLVLGEVKLVKRPLALHGVSTHHKEYSVAFADGIDDHIFALFSTLNTVSIMIVPFINPTIAPSSETGIHR